MFRASPSHRPTFHTVTFHTFLQCHSVTVSQYHSVTLTISRAVAAPAAELSRCISVLYQRGTVTSSYGRRYINQLYSISNKVLLCHCIRLISLPIGSNQLVVTRPYNAPGRGWGVGSAQKQNTFPRELKLSR